MRMTRSSAAAAMSALPACWHTRVMGLPTSSSARSLRACPSGKAHVRCAVASPPLPSLPRAPKGNYNSGQQDGWQLASGMLSTKGSS